MTPLHIQSAAQELLAGLPQRLDQVFRPWAESAPERPALIGDGKVWTYGALEKIVDDAATALRRHGVRPGDRVMVVSENSLALAALILAVSAIDAWSVVANPRLSEREIDQIRDHSGARLVYYTVEVSELARAHARRHDARAVDMGPLGTLHIGPLNETTVPETVEEDGARQVAALLYTSGTTGNPKGVMLTHRNILFNASISRARSPTDGGRRDLRRPADVAHRGLLDHPGGNPDRRQRRPFGSEVRSRGLCECRSRARHLPAVRRAHDLPAPARIQGRGRPQYAAARTPARSLCRRRAARSHPQTGDRDGIRPSSAQRLRHHRVRAGHLGRTR